MYNENINPAAEQTETGDPVQAAIERFIALDREYAKVREWLDAYRTAKRDVFEQVGPGHYFQDDEGIVYKTEEIEGKFVYFDPVEIKRTKREGEPRVSLSVKEATENGFTV